MFVYFGGEGDFHQKSHLANYPEELVYKEFRCSVYSDAIVAVTNNMTVGHTGVRLLWIH